MRSAIRGVSGHDHDQVIVQGTGPVNSEVACAPGTPAGYDWVSYHADILDRLKVNYEIQADGFAIHAYTHDSSSANVQCDDPDYHHGCVTDPANGPQRHYQFLTYRDILAATPAIARQLPVYITESDQERAPNWDDTPNDWIQKACSEINSWNSDPSHQRIRALAIYRWAPYLDVNNQGDGKYDISRRPNVLNDFAAALTHPYRWDAADCDVDTTTQMNMCDGPNGRFRASFKHFGLDAVGLHPAVHQPAGESAQHDLPEQQGARALRIPHHRDPPELRVGGQHHSTVPLHRARASPSRSWSRARFPRRCAMRAWIAAASRAPTRSVARQRSSSASATWPATLWIAARTVSARAASSGSFTRSTPRAAWFRIAIDRQKGPRV